MTGLPKFQGYVHLEGNQCMNVGGDHGLADWLDVHGPRWRDGC